MFSPEIFLHLELDLVQSCQLAKNYTWCIWIAVCTKSLNLHLVVWQWHGTRGVDPFTGLGVVGGGGQKLEKCQKFWRKFAI